MLLEFEKKLTFCPCCGGSNFKAGDFKPWTCSDCDFVFYQNAAAATAALVLNEKNQLLLVKRAKEPAKGKWDLPGGFIDSEESAEMALQRECVEEIGLEIESLNYLCSSPNIYHFGGLIYHTVDIFFTATANLSADIRPLDEVTHIAWFDLESIPLDDISFPSCRGAIERLINSRK